VACQPTLSLVPSWRPYQLSCVNPAGECPLEKAVLVAKPRAARIIEEDPAFRGATFRVKRWASVFGAPLPAEDAKAGMRYGYTAAEVVGPKGSFIIRQTFDPHGAPAQVGASWRADEPATDERKIEWGRNDAYGLQGLPARRGNEIFDIWTGPLEGFVLTVRSCDDRT
jgi:hypothetical protein